MPFFPENSATLHSASFNRSLTQQGRRSWLVGKTTMSADDLMMLDGIGSAGNVLDVPRVRPVVQSREATTKCLSLPDLYKPFQDQPEQTMESGSGKGPKFPSSRRNVPAPAQSPDHVPISASLTPAHQDQSGKPGLLPVSVATQNCRRKPSLTGSERSNRSSLDQATIHLAALETAAEPSKHQSFGDNFFMPSVGSDADDEMTDTEKSPGLTPPIATEGGKGIVRSVSSADRWAAASVAQDKAAKAVSTSAEGNWVSLRSVVRQDYSNVAHGENPMEAGRIQKPHDASISPCSSPKPRQLDSLPKAGRMYQDEELEIEEEILEFQCMYPSTASGVDAQPITVASAFSLTEQDGPCSLLPTPVGSCNLPDFMRDSPKSNTLARNDGPLQSNLVILDYPDEISRTGNKCRQRAYSHPTSVDSTTVNINDDNVASTAAAHSTLSHSTSLPWDYIQEQENKKSGGRSRWRKAVHNVVHTLPRAGSAIRKAVSSQSLQAATWNDPDVSAEQEAAYAAKRLQNTRASSVTDMRSVAASADGRSLHSSCDAASRNSLSSAKSMSAIHHASDDIHVTESKTPSLSMCSVRDDPYVHVSDNQQGQAPQIRTSATGPYDRWSTLQGRSAEYASLPASLRDDSPQYASSEPGSRVNLATVGVAEPAGVSQSFKRSGSTGELAKKDRRPMSLLRHVLRRSSSVDVPYLEQEPKKIGPPVPRSIHTGEEMASPISKFRERTMGAILEEPKEDSLTKIHRLQSVVSAEVRRISEAQHRPTRTRPFSVALRQPGTCPRVSETSYTGSVFVDGSTTDEMCQLDDTEDSAFEEENSAATSRSSIGRGEVHRPNPRREGSRALARAWPGRSKSKSKKPSCLGAAKQAARVPASQQRQAARVTRLSSQAAHATSTSQSCGRGPSWIKAPPSCLSSDETIVTDYYDYSRPESRLAPVKDSNQDMLAEEDDSRASPRKTATVTTFLSKTGSDCEASGVEESPLRHPQSFQSPVPTVQAALRSLEKHSAQLQSTMDEGPSQNRTHVSLSRTSPLQGLPSGSDKKTLPKVARHFCQCQRCGSVDSLFELGISHCDAEDNAPDANAATSDTSSAEHPKLPHGYFLVDKRYAQMTTPL
ncbi:uncharacterized protein LOC135829326 [Sycon ciliatum]|uniref:uncharacterized protein LOC135829326 n=1 Tax=Sycon ciliatum TaxID=27933 RepID=UPI0031F69B33